MFWTNALAILAYSNNKHLKELFMTCTFQSIPGH